MNERERFEEWKWKEFQKEVKDYRSLETITREELFCYEGGRYYRQDTYYQWTAYQMRAEIAKQDEKELIKALKYYANNQHVTKHIRQGKEFIEIENGEIATKALEKLNG